MTRRLAFQVALCALLIFAVSLFLNWPMFSPGESPHRQSIEPGYASMAKFVSEHPSPWGWNPLRYDGVPTRLMYVPATLYGAALLSHLMGTEPDRAFHLLTATFTCLGSTFAFLMAFYFTRRISWSLLLALAYTFFSPLYGLVPQIQGDQGITQVPWRFQVFVKYGEGPHNTALSLIPLVVVALAAAMKNRRYVLPAAFGLALIPLINWVGGLSLAICSAMLLLSVLGSPERSSFRIGRALLAGTAAYLLACFWLSPGFVRNIVSNWPVDTAKHPTAFPALFVLLVLLVSLRALLYWLRASTYLTFVSLGAVAFGWITLIFYFSGTDTIPESHRYASEFELFLFLALFELARLAFATGRTLYRVCAILPAIVALVQGQQQVVHYVTAGWAEWKPLPKEATAEYKVADWLRQRNPRGRVLASGGLRYRLNNWFDIPQVGGTFESGLRNRKAFEIGEQIRSGVGDGAESIRKLRALGVEYVVIHGPQSREFYRDYRDPGKFEGLLPRVYANNGDFIYQVPFDDLADAGKSAWSDAEHLVISGEFVPAKPLLVRVSYDPGWSATQNGTAVAVEQNSLGLMTLSPAGGNAPILLGYDAGWEPKICACISALTALALVSARLWDRQKATQSP